MAEKVRVVKAGKYLTATGSFSGDKAKANVFGSAGAAKGFMTRKKVPGAANTTVEPVDPNEEPPAAPAVTKKAKKD